MPAARASLALRPAAPLGVPLALPIATLLTLACAAGGGGGTAATRIPPADAARAAELADLDLCRAVVARDQAAFARLVAPDALFLGGPGPAAGRAAVLAAWAPYFQADGPRLRWAPDRIEASPSGDLIFTFGPWSFRAPGGEPEVGRYLTAWRREPDGMLRAVLDGDAAPLPPLPDGVARRPLTLAASTDGQLLAEGGLLVEGGREVGHYLLFSRREGVGLLTVAAAGRYRPPAP